MHRFIELVANLNPYLLFLFSFLLLSLMILIFTLKNPYLSGDEPHYYVISSSIFYDRDFELKNNYFSMDYKYVNPTTIMPHCHEGRNGGWFSFHLPGISFIIVPLIPILKLLSPPWNVFLIRLFFSISGILLSFQIFRFLKREGFERKICLTVYFISLFLSPFIFHSFHLYPEILCAFISLFFLNEIIEEKISGSRGLLNGILLGFVFFLNQKYYVIILLLLILYFHSILRKKSSLKISFSFIISFFLIFGLLILYVWETFGVLSPFSIRREVSTLSSISAFFGGFEPLYFFESFFNYFLDQRDGLIFYAPFLLFSFLGLFEITKKNRSILIKLFSIAIPYVLLYAWNLGRGGYSPFARPLMAVSWVFPISLAYFLEENRKNIWKNFFSLSLYMGLLFEFFLFKYPQFLYQPTTKGISERAGSLFLFFSHLYLPLHSYLPSFIKVPNLAYIPNYFWIIILVLILIFYKKIKNTMEVKNLALYGFMIFYIVTLVLFPRIRYFRPQEFPVGSLNATFFSMSRNINLIDKNFFVLRDNNYYIPFLTEKKLNKLIFHFKSEDFFQMDLLLFDLPFFKGIVKEGSLFFEIPPSLNYRGKKLYLLALKIKNTRKLKSTYSPFTWRIEGQ